MLKDILYIGLFLFFSVPPDKPTIRNQNGRELLSYEIGPYEIDEDLMIDCEVTGGKKGPFSLFAKGFPICLKGDLKMLKCCCLHEFRYISNV